MSTPAEKFLNFYERSENTQILRFGEYFEETFENQSSIKYQVKYHNNKIEQLKNICNSILKNLHLNSQFLTEGYYQIDFFKNFYNLIRGIVNEDNIDENSLPKLMLCLHTSKANLRPDQFENNFDTIGLLQILKPVDNLMYSNNYFIKL